MHMFHVEHLAMIPRIISLDLSLIYNTSSGAESRHVRAADAVAEVEGVHTGEIILLFMIQGGGQEHRI